MVPGPLDRELQEAVTQAARLAGAAQCAELLALIPRTLRAKGACMVSYLTLSAERVGQAWEEKGWGNQGSLPGEGESGDGSNMAGRKCFECVRQNSLAKKKATEAISDEGWELHLP